MRRARGSVGTAFFAGPTLEVARALVGATLEHRGCAGRIVEVEAYAGDPASHYVTRPVTGAIMGSSHGRVYVYRIYGVHACLNFTTDAHGPGAVLLRALEPLEGLPAMRRRRGIDDPRLLCAGPGRLVEALGVTPALTGRLVADLFDVRLPEEPVEVGTGPRIGISEAKDLPWRFFLRGSRYLSRPAPREAGVPPAPRAPRRGRRGRPRGPR